jgi:hypothetical protein
VRGLVDEVRKQGRHTPIPIFMDSTDVAPFHHYISGYSGHAKVVRLLHVGTLPISTSVRLACLRMTAHELREHSVDVKQYLAVCAESDVKIDEEWVAKVRWTDS